MSFITDTSATDGPGGITFANASQRRGSPFGLTYSLVPDVDASRTSGQPSPVKSPANSSQLDEKSTPGLRRERHVELALLREVRARRR